MLTDKENRVNLNKRILDSPTEPSHPKRIMTDGLPPSVPSSSFTNDGDLDGPLTTKSFQQILNATLDKKLANLATKTDIDTVKQDVVLLQNNLQSHESRLHQMEWKQRAKNVIFKYIPQKKSYKAYISSLLQNIMGLEIQPRSIFILRVLPDKKQVILLVEFLSNDEVHEIFSKVNTLKSTNIIIEKDLSAEERKRKGVLLNIRKEVLKRAKENNISIKIVVSENRIRFNDDGFVFDRSSNEFFMGSSGTGVILREYILDKFNVLVDINYTIIVNA